MPVLMLAVMKSAAKSKKQIAPIVEALIHKDITLIIHDRLSLFGCVDLAIKKDIGTASKRKPSKNIFFIMIPSLQKKRAHRFLLAGKKQAPFSHPADQAGREF